jgi:hypothetical protein
MSRPTHFADAISEQEWQEKVTTFNSALISWWDLGGFLRDLFSSCLICYCWSGCCFDYYDEAGGQVCSCFRNRRRKEALDILTPICQQLSANSRLIWSVSFFPDSKFEFDQQSGLYTLPNARQQVEQLKLDLANGVNLQGLELILTVKLATPIYPFTPPPKPFASIVGGLMMMPEVALVGGGQVGGSNQIQQIMQIQQMMQAQQMTHVVGPPFLAERQDVTPEPY